MSIDQRRSPRVEFFLVPEEHEQLPVWVIKPQSLADARGGVVVNLSEEGLQILTAAEPPLDAQHYEPRLLLGEDEGVQGMKVGGTRFLVLPPELGYGAHGAGGVIPPNATLLFEVELLAV